MAKSKELRRVHIQSVLPRGTSSDHKPLKKMNVYVDNDPRMKVGSQITLKDSEMPSIMWEITEMH